jgi:hypothetical protein
MKQEFIEKLARETGIRLRTVERLCASIDAVGMKRFCADSRASFEFLYAFCRLWHELALQGDDPQILVEVAQAYHSLAVIDGDKPQASRHWIESRALEELGLLMPVKKQKGRYHDRSADRSHV